mmetsp:Transcript_20889/g.52905  ORF Transcript_20889/g.52905 Transcript_20889/m.52905 type:complete len:232 (-) Transcript_20889:3014-3709(-)
MDDARLFVVVPFLRGLDALVRPRHVGPVDRPDLLAQHGKQVVARALRLVERVPRALVLGPQVLLAGPDGLWPLGVELAPRLGGELLQLHLFLDDLVVLGPVLALQVLEDDVRQHAHHHHERHEQPVRRGGPHLHGDVVDAVREEGHQLVHAKEQVPAKHGQEKRQAVQPGQVVHLKVHHNVDHPEYAVERGGASGKHAVLLPVGAQRNRVHKQHGEDDKHRVQHAQAQPRP